MSDKLKRIVAIIALVLMGIFTVSLILTFMNIPALNGKIDFLTMFSGFFGIVLFLVVRFSKSDKHVLPKNVSSEKDKDAGGEAVDAPENAVSEEKTADEADSEDPAKKASDLTGK